MQSSVSVTGICSDAGEGKAYPRGVDKVSHRQHLKLIFVRVSFLMSQDVYLYGPCRTDWMINLEPCRPATGACTHSENCFHTFIFSSFSL